jgi:hypothetical protein
MQIEDTSDRMEPAPVTCYRALIACEHTEEGLSKRKGARSPPLGSEKATLSKAEGLATGDDQVIEDADVHQAQRFAQSAGYELVGLG